MFRFLPEQASDFADRVDGVNNLITDISVFFTVAIVGAMIYFAVKYRKKDNKDHATPQIEGSHFLEMMWTIVPTIICAIVGIYGYVVFKDMRTVPDNAIEVNVWGSKWLWEFEYANGKKTSSELVVPVNEPTKLIMQAKDVLHSFFIPSMRVKADLIPSRYTYIWFRPIKTGNYQVFCTEYCGTNHSAMLATLRVVSKAEYEMWLADDPVARAKASMKPSEFGQKLYNDKGCKSCHSLDGNRVVGPSFLKLFGRESKMSDGSMVKADENYIRESILNPTAKTVDTYPAGVMPSFMGQLNDYDISSIISFIKTIDGSQAAPAPVAAPATSAADLAKLSPEERGKKIYNEKACAGCHSLDGSKIVGPSFKGVYGREGKLSDGSSYKADDAYIKNSIVNPASQVVEGFPPAMPSFQGQLSDEDINGVIAFMKTLK